MSITFAFSYDHLPPPASYDTSFWCDLGWCADIDDAAKEIVYRNYVDVSVAVSSPNGLVVPVLRNVEDMGEETGQTSTML